MLEFIIPISLGIGLSAATGIRVFLPLFLISLYKYYEGHLFMEYFNWLDSVPVMITLGVATIIEISSYYIPVVDHALDVISAPVSFLAGSITMISTLPDMPSYINAILGLIIGGTTAVGMTSIMGFTRAKVSLTSIGSANFLFSTIEIFLSGILTLLSFLVPIFIAIFCLILLVFSVRRIRQYMLKNSYKSN